MSTEEALRDLRDRLIDAEQSLRMLAAGHDVGTPDRLNGKAEGVTLALPYADHPDYDEAWRP